MNKTTTTLTLLIIIGLVGGFFLGQSTAQPGVRTVYVTSVDTRTVSVTFTVATTVTEVVERHGPDVRYAKLFELENRGGYVLLRDGLNRTVVAVPRGAAVPDVRADLVVRIPVQRAVLMSATHVALVERLREYDPGLLGRVAGLMWGGSYSWFFPEVERLLQRGVIKDVGAAWSPDYEQLVALQPDLVMIYTYPGDPVVSKLEELKLPYVVVSEYLEDDLLGRFEWIKFVAAFFELGDVADKVFSFVEQSVLLTSLRARTLLEHGASPPKVVWFSVYRGTVYVAGGGSYVARALKDLGASYVFSDIASTGSATVTPEELVARALNADVIILSTDLITTREDLLKELPQLADSKAFRENRVYRYSSDIFQLGYYASEEWFRDLAKMLYPEAFDGGGGPRFFVEVR
ncbi:MAG: ABC transporter substrate-binding protein [Candidatus Caldarchaeum sp.]|nr:ABC transporter substrate-binding protein [Candidatus Caldarchaeales archaeon]MDJ0272145.1 ABC transporter substrate-binding protein [Candidatus Caldarchaeales archaeon]